MIEFRNISFVYDANTPDETIAIKNISFKIEFGEFVAIIGHTGSGKSTLIRLFNGLEKATSGDILYNGESIYQKGYNFRRLREKIGLLFQYPEDQLFESEVLSDVCFGPMNFGISKSDAMIKAKETLQSVGVEEKYFHLSPFELSEGLKRKVAIAGVLAMYPKILILDELTAGLDSQGKRDILNLIKKLNDKKKITIIWVSHCMEDVAEYAKRIMVMSHGSILYDDTPQKVFNKKSTLESIGLSVPKVTHIVCKLKELGLNVDTSVITLEDAKETILRSVGDFHA